MFKILTSGCEPTRGSEFSACVDLYASEDVTIEAGATKLVGLGVSLDIDFLLNKIFPITKDEKPASLEMQNKGREQFMKSHYFQLMLRSSMSKHLIISNGVGIIDIDYKDEIKIRLHHPMAKEDLNRAGQGYRSGYREIKIKKGDRIAQITLLRHSLELFDIETTATRTGGFGSTN